jgi:hypothetical protein
MPRKKTHKNIKLDKNLSTESKLAKGSKKTNEIKRWNLNCTFGNEKY